MEKHLSANVGDKSLIPGSGRLPGEENDYPLQYSCLENPMDREAWQLQSMGLQRVGHHLVTREQQSYHLDLGIHNSLVPCWVAETETVWRGWPCQNSQARADGALDSPEAKGNMWHDRVEPLSSSGLYDAHGPGSYFLNSKMGCLFHTGTEKSSHPGYTFLERPKWPPSNYSGSAIEKVYKHRRLRVKSDPHTP